MDSFYSAAALKFNVLEYSANVTTSILGFFGGYLGTNLGNIMQNVSRVFILQNIMLMVYHRHEYPKTLMMSG